MIREYLRTICEKCDIELGPLGVDFDEGDLGLSSRAFGPDKNVPRRNYSVLQWGRFFHFFIFERLINL